MVEYSPTSAFWTFTKVSNFAYTRYNTMIKHINKKQDQWENQSIHDIKNLERHIVSIYEKDPEKAIEQLTNFSNQRTREVVNDWNKLFEYLLVKYHDGNIKKEENGKFLTNESENPQAVFPDQPKYPDKWYHMIVNDCGKNIILK
jgi:dipeptidase